MVFLHCNILAHSFQPTNAWKGALVVEVLVYWAVPVFFMLTGANNMRYREKYTTSVFLKRRMKKLLIPFVAWTLIIYFIQHAAAHDMASLSVYGYITGFMGGSIEGIYWFFFAIISLTLAMPVLSLLVEHRRILWYMVGGAFILGGVAPYLFQLLNIPWTGAFQLPVVGGGGIVVYALLGYLLSTQEVPKKYRIVIYIAAILCLVLRYVFTYYSSFQIGQTDTTLFDYSGFFAVIPAAAVFLLFKYHNWDDTFFARHQQAVITISGCSFGVYLIHKLFIIYVVAGYLNIGYDRILMRLVAPLFVYLASLLVVYAMKKIPGIKNIVP